MAFSDFLSKELITPIDTSPRSNTPTSQIHRSEALQDSISLLRERITAWRNGVILAQSTMPEHSDGHNFAQIEIDTLNIVLKELGQL